MQTHNCYLFRKYYNTVRRQYMLHQLKTDPLDATTRYFDSFDVK